MQDASGKKDAGWVRRPNDVVAVEVCRLSGALPAEGCRRATVVKDNGEVTSESAVGQEFFRFGTEPIDECPIHGNGSYSGERRSIIGSMSGISAMRATNAPAPSQVRPQPINGTSIYVSAPAAASTTVAGSVLADAGRAAMPAVAAAPAKSAAAANAELTKKPGVFSRIKRVFGGGSGAAPPPLPTPKPTGRGGGG
jgi:hypothetical protein